MTILQHDKLDHIFYCISKDELKNSYYFLVSNDYYLIKLKSNKLVFESYNAPITARDRRMIETLGYWLNDLSLNLDNIYMYIRLKSNDNKDFVHWWTRYNFQIEIERTLNYDYYRNKDTAKIS